MRVRAAEGKGSWAARYHRSWCACACVCGAIVGQGLMRGTRDRHASMVDPGAQTQPLAQPVPEPDTRLVVRDSYACYPIVLAPSQARLAPL